MLQALYLLLAPAFALWLTRRYRWAGFFGPVVFAYVFGIAWPELVGLLPGQSHLPVISHEIMNIAIPLAIPLLLFTLDLRGWLRDALPSVLSFILAIVSMLAMAGVGFLVIGRGLENGAEIVGMLTGMYSGGAPNMAVVHASLELPPELYLRVNATDVLVGGVYFLFLVSLAKPVFGWVLRPWTGEQVTEVAVNADTRAAPEDKLRLLLAIITAIAIVGVAALASKLLVGHLAVPLVMLTITSLAIAASFIPALRAARLSFETGYYLVLVFCVAIGSTVDLAQLLTNPGPILLLVLLMFPGGVLLHLILAKLFRIDRDTFIITSTAAMYGPPFIPPVASALKNPTMLLSGLTTGLVGYAIGNYLGLGVVWLLR